MLHITGLERVGIHPALSLLLVCSNQLLTGPTLSASVTLLNLLTGPFVRVGVIQNNNLLWRVLLQGLCLVLPPKQELINIKRFEQLELEGIGACDSGIIPNCFPNMERLSYNSVTVGRKDCKVES